MPLVELFCCVLSANNQAKTFLRHAGCSSRDDLCCPELNSGIVRVSRLLQFSAPGDLGSNN